MTPPCPQARNALAPLCEGGVKTEGFDRGIVISGRGRAPPLRTPTPAQSPIFLILFS